jgi:pyruvate dehydrogenase E1 component
MYLFKPVPEKSDRKKTVQLMGSGTILREVLAAGELLEKDWNIPSEIWSIPGINQLHRDGIETERWNRFHPEEKQKSAYATRLMKGHPGPTVIATDYIRSYPEQIRRLIPNPLTVLGTDGYGRSDTRAKLRKHFEVDRYHIVTAALAALSREGVVPAGRAAEALKKYGIDPEAENPLTH